MLSALTDLWPGRVLCGHRTVQNSEGKQCQCDQQWNSHACTKESRHPPWGLAWCSWCMVAWWCSAASVLQPCRLCSPHCLCSQFCAGPHAGMDTMCMDTMYMWVQLYFLQWGHKQIFYSFSDRRMSLSDPRLRWPPRGLFFVRFWYGGLWLPGILKRRCCSNHNERPRWFADRKLVVLGPQW